MKEGRLDRTEVWSVLFALAAWVAAVLGSHGHAGLWVGASLATAAVALPTRSKGWLFVCGIVAMGAWAAATRPGESGSGTLRDQRCFTVGDVHERAFGGAVDLDCEGYRYAGTSSFRLDPAPRGSTVEVSGNVGPYRGTEAQRLGRHLVGEIRLDSLGVRSGPRFPWSLSHRIRTGAEELLRGIGADRSGLVQGVVFGDESKLSPSESLRFVRSGMTHLLVASGQNLAVILGALAPLLTRVDRRPRQVISSLAALMVACATGAEPSMMRALAMVMVALWIPLRWGKPTVVTRCAWGAMAAILADPMLVHRVGFQLSVVATAAVVATVRWHELRGFGWSALRLGLVVNTVVTTSVAVVICWHFDVSAVAGLLVNPVAMPIAAALMVIGTIGLPLAVLVPWTAGLYRSVVAALALGLHWCARVGAVLPMRPVTMWMAVACTLAVLWWMKHPSRARWGCGAVLLAVMMAIPTHRVVESRTLVIRESGYTATIEVKGNASPEVVAEELRGLRVAMVSTTLTRSAGRGAAEALRLIREVFGTGESL